jgi:hypothetical protein
MALEGGEGSAARPGRTLPPRKDPVPIAQEAGWAPGPVWTSAENLALTGIRFPDRPARSKSLYRLSYTAHRFSICFNRIETNGTQTAIKLIESSPFESERVRLTKM